MATHGGTISWKAKELARTIVSGPIGGVIGSQATSAKRWATRTSPARDIGGTSLRRGADHQGQLCHQVRPRHGPARAVACLWWRWTRSARAPAASYGSTPIASPSSSGRTARAIASACAGRRAGSTRSRCPTAMSCSAISTPTTSSAAPSSSTSQRATTHIKAQIADPLGLSVEDAAAGVIELLDLSCATICAPMISAKGYNPTELRLLLLRRRRPGACLRIYRRSGLQGRDRPGMGRGLLGLWLRLLQISSTATTRVVDIALAPDRRRSRQRTEAAQVVQAAWEELADKVLRSSGINGFSPKQVRLQPGYRMQYMRPAQRSGDRFAAAVGAATRTTGTRLVDAFNDDLRTRLCAVRPLARTRLLDAPARSCGARCRSPSRRSPRRPRKAKFRRPTPSPGTAVLPQEEVGGRRDLQDGVACGPATTSPARRSSNPTQPPSSCRMASRPPSTASAVPSARKPDIKGNETMNRHDQEPRKEARSKLPILGLRGGETLKQHRDRLMAATRNHRPL